MPIGLSIFNSSGYSVVEADVSYPGYQILQEGTGTNGNAVSFPAQPEPPIVVIKPLDTTYPCTALVVSTDTFTISLYGNNNSAPGTQPYQYKVLVPIKNLGASATNAGVKVYSASGQIMFDTGYVGSSNFRVAAVYTIFPDSSTVTYDLPADSGEYYFTANSTRKYVDEKVWMGSPFNYWAFNFAYYGIKKNSATQFSSLRTLNFSGSSADAPTEQTNTGGKPLSVIFGTFI